jgi:hypothetical protein
MLLRPPGNIWTSEEFVDLIRNTVATLHDLDLGDLLKADKAGINNAVKHVCGEINSQVKPAGNA